MPVLISEAAPSTRLDVESRSSIALASPAWARSTTASVCTRTPASTSSVVTLTRTSRGLPLSRFVLELHAELQRLLSARGRQRSRLFPRAMRHWNLSQRVPLFWLGCSISSTKGIEQPFIQRTSILECNLAQRKTFRFCKLLARRKPRESAAEYIGWSPIPRAPKW